MAKTLDFNSLQQPELHIVLKDEARTGVRLTIPSPELLIRLQKTLPALQASIKTGNEASVATIYNLAADLINENLDGFKTDGEKLRTEYHLGLGELLAFFTSYGEFVNEIKGMK